jgi:hypothetical protein
VPVLVFKHVSGSKRVLVKPVKLSFSYNVEFYVLKILIHIHDKAIDMKVGYVSKKDSC